MKQFIIADKFYHHTTPKYTFISASMILKDLRMH